ncbi:membrane dipeptidase [Nocardia amikacinitolerans]|uniref:Membrane dipeptidase n=1 Tax=Nocardia amikacinitolerans TaxID=756689 RepID=A0A285L8B1_9NOCA|nr:dipeptidase [Nocardia amikacinitolerans]SNY79621.1 membrane dipeptidase [Nocardia amikacinitolerans]
MPVSTEAKQVHDSATVIDLHADTPKLISRGYDFAVRHRPRWPISRYVGHVDLPRMREGGLAAQWFGMWTAPYPRRGTAADIHRQLDALDETARAHPDRFRLATTGDDIRRARAEGVSVGLRGIEGGQALEGDLGNLVAFARRGVRYLGLLHFSRSEIGCPAMGIGRSKEEGLTGFGCEVVDACAELGVLVDLAHINRPGFFDAIARARGPVIVSHTGVAGVRPMWRNIDDEQIRAIADTGGVVGVIFSPAYLGGELDAVVDHLLHIIDVGGRETVALGSDWDGFIRPARGLESPAQLPLLTDALLRRGLSAETIHLLLGGNALRVLDAISPSR